MDFTDYIVFISQFSHLLHLIIYKMCGISMNDIFKPTSSYGKPEFSKKSLKYYLKFLKRKNLMTIEFRKLWLSQYKLYYRQREHSTQHTYEQWWIAS